MKQYHKIQSVFKRDNNGQFTDEYVMPEIEHLKDNQWVFTEKVDGTNIRVMWNGENVTFGGKSDNAQMPVFLFYKLQEMFEGTKVKQLFIEQFGNEPTEVCLYGEGYGAGIQSGGNYIADGASFVLFDVKIGDSYLLREDVEEIAEKFGIKIVPIIGKGTIDEAIKMTKKGFNSQWGDFRAEGIVLRPEVELNTRRGDRIITKLKYKDFIK